jgi:hypothetical protein
MATILNLIIDQGSDYSKTHTVSQDLTGYSCTSQIRKSASALEAFGMSVSILGDPVNGTIEMSMSAADSDLIPSGRYLYDVEAYNSGSGSRLRILEGMVTVTPSMTKI